jgi:hypothetical protein
MSGLPALRWLKVATRPTAVDRHSEMATPKRPPATSGRSIRYWTESIGALARPS